MNKRDSKEWELLEPLSSEWKKEILPILELFVDRVPGSFIEATDFSLVWHYRDVETSSGDLLSNELVTYLTYLAANLELEVLKGAKAIEIKNVRINKGRAVIRVLSQHNFQFILAIGDDFTDEYLFRVLSKSAYSIKVGITSSLARFNVANQQDVRALLTELSKIGSR